MAFVEFVLIEKICKNGVKRSSKQARCRCDQCKKEFILIKNVKKVLAQRHQFCSSKCHACAMKKNGVSGRQKDATCFGRYGRTCFVADPEIARIAGAKGNSPEALLKRDATCMERYGVRFPFHTRKAKLRSRAAAHTPEVEARRTVSIRKTMHERHGVSCGFQLPHVIERTRSEKTRSKAMETLKRHGFLRTSKPEEEMHQRLVQIFGYDDVERHVRLHRHSVDFFIKSIATFIQFDGIFWHGLDRSIEEIERSPRVIDASISKKWRRDRALDEFAKANEIRLIRFSEPDLADDVWIERVHLHSET